MKLLKIYGIINVCISILGIGFWVYIFFREDIVQYQNYHYFKSKDIIIYMIVASLFLWIFLSGIATLKKSKYIKTYLYWNFFIFLAFSSFFSLIPIVAIKEGLNKTNMYPFLAGVAIALNLWSCFVLTVVVFFHKPIKEYIHSFNPSWKLNFHPGIFLLALCTFSLGSLLFYSIKDKFYSESVFPILTTDLLYNNPKLYNSLSAMLDNTPETCSKVSSKTGENAVIEIPIPKEIFISGLEIQPGSHDKPDTKENEFFWYNRISEFTVESTKGEKKVFSIKDESNIQKFTFGPWETEYLRITINKVKEGSAFQSLCISHLQILEASKLFR